MHYDNSCDLVYMYPADFSERPNHRNLLFINTWLISSGSHNKPQKFHFQFQWDKYFTITLLLIETSSSLRNTRCISVLMVPDGFKESHSYFHQCFGGLILQCCPLFDYQLSEAIGSAGRCGCLLLTSQI